MGYYLADYGGEKTIADYFAKMKDMSKLAKAVSWLIQGDESLEEELQEGTLADLTEAIEIGVGLMGVENFPRLSRSGKSVQTMIAKQR